MVNGWAHQLLQPASCALIISQILPDITQKLYALSSWNHRITKFLNEELAWDFTKEKYHLEWVKKCKERFDKTSAFGDGEVALFYG